MQIIWRKVKVFLKEFPKWFGLYLALAGLITFNLFILEEAFQTCMFGSWPAADVGEWRVVKRNLKTMEGLHDTLVVTNYVGGWINPFAFVSYSGYAKAEREYMDGLRAKVFANAPELFAGEKVTTAFVPNEEERLGGAWLLRNGRVSVLAMCRLPEYTGIVEIIDGNPRINCLESKK